jgi:lipopolysaccharide/colanic/teichoic acid biosynthesis glycosyltransferase
MRPLIHSIIIWIIYRWAYQIRLSTNGFRSIDIGTPRIATNELIIYTIISIIIFLIIGIIKRRYDLIGIWLQSTQHFLSVRGQWTIIITCLAYFWQWSIFVHGISRFVILQVAFASLIIIPIIEWIREWWYRRRIQKFSHSVLILSHDQNQSNDIVDQLSLPSYYDISKKKFSWHFSWEIKQDIVILVGSYTQDELQYFIDLIRLQSKELYHIWDNHFLEDVIYTPSQIWWIKALRYTSSQIEWRASIIKRSCDVIWSIFWIIGVSPILLITAIAIKINSKGPIFYTQKRVWKNWKNFTFVKFRSMYTHLSVWEWFWGKKAETLYQELVNSHANIRKWELPKIKDDPRVTAVWKFIRATSIDELPNLFSVIKWDMSLIWPRPHLPSEIENYKPRQRRVLSIKPWITWYAQIHWRDSLTFDEEASKELEYIQNWSLWLDFYIIFATFGVLFWWRWK